MWLLFWIANIVDNIICVPTSVFAALVCTTLDLYSSSGKLIKFLIDFKYTGSYFFYVDKWVHFATTHNVENLYL